MIRKVIDPTYWSQATTSWYETTIDDSTMLYSRWFMANRDREVIKIKSKLTNLMKISRIEGYNGK